jgi:hypothetical protein
VSTMDIQKIAALATMASTATQAGMVIIGGYRALAALFNHDLTPAEQDAIEVSVIADATRRLAESRRMAGVYDE